MRTFKFMPMLAGLLVCFPALTYSDPIPRRDLDQGAALSTDSGRKAASLAELLRNQPEFSRFYALVKQTGVTAPLLSPGTDEKGYTLFVPSNSAIEAAPPLVMEELLRNQDILERVVKYHMVAKRIDATEFKTGLVSTLLGEQISLVVSKGGNIRANDVSVNGRTLHAENGVIHPVDELMLPPTVHAMFVQRAIIPLAPVMARILGERNFVLDGSSRIGRFGSGSTFVAQGSRTSTGTGTIGSDSNTSNTATIVAGNGTVDETNRAMRFAGFALSNRIAESPNHAMFSRLLQETGLDEMLAAEGPYTVLAPTDRAFDNLPHASKNAILADGVLLREVLTHHLLTQRIESQALKSGQSIRSMQGESISVRIGANGAAKFNSAIVLQRDLDAQNGVVHSLNQVLIPKSVIQTLKNRGIGK